MNTLRSQQLARGLKRRAAFTLIELLTVIAILSILVGMTLGIISYAQDTASAKKTEVGLALIDAGIAKYVDEYGEFPIPIDNDGKGIAGAMALYQALTGDGDDMLEGGEGVSSNGKFEDNEKMFIDMRSEGFVAEDGQDYFLKDGYDRPFNFQVYDKNRPDATNQKTYDLWSYGTDKEKKKKNQAKWIKNW